MFRRRFQFRLRMLLIAVTVLCIVGGGYLGWQAKVVRARKALLQIIVDGGGGYFRSDHVRDYALVGELPPKGNRVPELIGKPVGNRFAHEPPLIRRWFGDEFIDQIMITQRSSESEISKIKESFPEATIFKYAGASQP